MSGLPRREPWKILITTVMKRQEGLSTITVGFETKGIANAAAKKINQPPAGTVNSYYQTAITLWGDDANPNNSLAGYEPCSS